MEKKQTNFIMHILLNAVFSSSCNRRFIKFTLSCCGDATHIQELLRKTIHSNPPRKECEIIERSNRFREFCLQVGKQSWDINCVCAREWVDAEGFLRLSFHSFFLLFCLRATKWVKIGQAKSQYGSEKSEQLSAPKQTHLKNGTSLNWNHGDGKSGIDWFSRYTVT